MKIDEVQTPVNLLDLQRRWLNPLKRHLFDRKAEVLSIQFPPPNARIGLKEAHHAAANLVKRDERLDAA